MKNWLYKDYFNKNIPIPTKKEYKIQFTQKIDSKRLFQQEYTNSN